MMPSDKYTKHNSPTLTFHNSTPRAITPPPISRTPIPTSDNFKPFEYPVNRNRNKG